MPLLLLGGLPALWYLITKPKEDDQAPQSAQQYPSWVIPTVIITVGGILLYKEGAKVLKL